MVGSIGTRRVPQTTVDADLVPWRAVVVAALSRGAVAVVFCPGRRNSVP